MKKNISIIRSIGGKILIILVAISAVAIIALTVLSVSSASKALKKSAFNQLESIQHIKQKQVIDYCDGKIARYKMPKSVSFVEALPFTASGKVQKNILKEQLKI